MRVALIQYRPAPGPEAVAGNRARLAELVARATAGSLVILPETATTTFHPKLRRHAEVLRNHAGEEVAFFSSLASDRKVHLLAGVLDASAEWGAWKNRATLFGPDGNVAGDYVKLHPFSYGGESEAFASGDAPVEWRVDASRLVPFICYDLRFPEAFRPFAGRCDLHPILANWPAKRAGHLRVLATARAIESQAWVAVTNLCGEVHGVDYAGGSALIDPKGEVVLDARGEEGCFEAEVDEGLGARWRAEFPALRDRKPSSYWVYFER